MKKIYLYMTTLLVSAVSLFTSCDSQLDQVNPNKATEATFWKNEKDFELALTSCYTPLKNALNGGYYGTRGVMMRIAPPVVSVGIGLFAGRHCAQASRPSTSGVIIRTAPPVAIVGHGSSIGLAAAPPCCPSTSGVQR